MAEGESEHFAPIGFGEAHKTIKDSTEGGACINGRCQGTYDTTSCSYRYQGIEAAKKYKHIYNHSDIPAKFHVDGRKGKKKSVIFEALSKSDERRKIAINGKYRVLIHAKTYKCELPTTKVGDVYKQYQEDVAVFRKQYWFVNFTVSSVPWKNQVHHVLNQSSLVKIIASFENITDVVSLGLLEELYNINHKDNMIILPTEKYWVRKTGLPLHCGSHPDYSEQILSEVENALSEYESLNEQAGKPDHPKPAPKPAKERLLKISKKWYKKIVDVVPNNKNASSEGDVIRVNDIE